MAVKKVYIGSVGPFLFDDTELVNDQDGDFAGEYQKALTTDGDVGSYALTVDDAPALLALLSGQATAAFDFNSQNLTGVGTIASGKITIPGSTSDSSVKIGSLELQGYAVNNAWVGENIYYDGSGYKYRADGFAVTLRMHLGGFKIWTAPSGSAGGAATLTEKFYVDNTGQVDILLHNASTIGLKLGGNLLKLLPDGAGVIETVDVIRGSTSLWYRATHISAFTADPGASGATFVACTANTLGGYQLSAANQELYFNESITSMWDGASDLTFRVTFEVNVDNTAGADGDTVDLKLVCYYKGDAETANKTQTLTTPTKTVGKSPQYKRFTTVFTIDWDLANNVVEVGDKMSFELTCEATGDVTNIIVNTAMFRYPTAKMNPEV